MRGSIRIIVSIIVLFGVAGGIDTASDSQLLILLGIAVAALGIMYSGIIASKS